MLNRGATVSDRPKNQNQNHVRYVVTVSLILVVGILVSLVLVGFPDTTPDEDSFPCTDRSTNQPTVIEEDRNCSTCLEAECDECCAHFFPGNPVAQANCEVGHSIGTDGYMCGGQEAMGFPCTDRSTNQSTVIEDHRNCNTCLEKECDECCEHFFPGNPVAQMTCVVGHSIGIDDYMCGGDSTQGL